MTSLKRHCLKNLSTDFSEILVKGIKLMPDTVLKVSRRYLLSFFSYRENTEGGNIYPPALRGLKAFTRVNNIVSILKYVKLM